MQGVVQSECLCSTSKNLSYTPAVKKTIWKFQCFFYFLPDSKSVVCFRYISNAFLTWKTVTLASMIIHVFLLAWLLYQNTLDQVVALEKATVEISEKLRTISSSSLKYIRNDMLL